MNNFNVTNPILKMKKPEFNLTVEQLMEQLRLHENKYEKALAQDKNYAIKKRYREKIKKLKEDLLSTAPAQSNSAI
jgi:hypothetical protein